MIRIPNDSRNDSEFDTNVIFSLFLSTILENGSKKKLMNILYKQEKRSSKTVSSVCELQIKVKFGEFFSFYEFA